MKSGADRRGATRPAVALGLALALGAALSGCNSLIYPAPQRDTTAVPDDVRVLSLVASDGVPVHALACTGADAAAPVIVYFHGNGNVAGDALGLARYVTQHGPSMLLVEYRGYGASVEAGTPSEDGLYADAEAALAYLRREGIADQRVVLWGYSLGSGVAAEMAVRGHGARLVLQAPFTSIVAVGEARFPWAPVSWVLSDRFDTASKAARIALPTLIVHGEDDEIVPFEMGKTLATTIPGATLVPVPGMTHSGGKQFRWVLDRILAFAAGTA